MQIERTPRWTIWRNTPIVQVFQAVALSMNIEPSLLAKHTFYLNRENPYDEGADFDARVSSIISNMKARIIPVVNPRALGITMFAYQWDLRLEDFKTFAQSAGWTLPDELTVLATPVVTLPSIANEQTSYIENELHSKPDESAAELTALTTSNIHAISQENDGLLKREKQIRAIEDEAKVLGYDVKEIPDDGKAQLMKLCKDKYSVIFGAGDEPFKAAWKEARKQNRVKMANHNKYIS